MCLERRAIGTFDGAFDGTFDLVHELGLERHVMAVHRMLGEPVEMELLQRVARAERDFF